MKRGFIVIALILVLLPTVYAEKSVYDYIREMDDSYVVALGDKGTSSDSISATKLVLSFKKNEFIDLELILEKDVSPNVNKILIGHPCNNGLINLPCDDWQYEEGQALVKVIGTDLILSGTLDQDIIYASELIANYNDYPILKQTSAVIVSESFVKDVGTPIIKAKNPHEFVCGDNKCEPGEKYLCFSDCQAVSCFDLCQGEFSLQAQCKDIPSNPNVEVCNQGWMNKGLGYCSTGKVCCCETEQEEQPQEQQQEEQPQEEEKRSLFRVIIDWFLEIFRAIF